MSDIAKKQMVVVTRVGSFWVDIDRAERIKRVRSSNPDTVIAIDESQIDTRSIYGILTPEQYYNYQNERRGLWQCEYRKWHPKNDTCTCARDKAERESVAPTNKLTDEQREKAQAKAAEIRSKILKKGIKGLKQ